jgi:hypothetical protein
MLELAAAVGEIQLMYLDESGFCMWSPVNYTYFPWPAETARTNPATRQKIEYFGVNPTLVSFVYGLVIGAFTSDSYIK